jgi:hypothetical protein
MDKKNISLEKKTAIKPPVNDLLKKKNYDRMKNIKTKEAEEVKPEKILENLEFDYPNMLKGLVFAEIFGKPKALRANRR